MTTEVKTQTQTFYSLDQIIAKKATYNVIFGERSNGKTFAILKHGLQDYIATGRQLAYVRRWKEDITGRRAQRLYEGLVDSGIVEELTNGEFTTIHYFSGKWYLASRDESGKIIYNDQNIIAFAFALSDSEHDKSTSYPNVGTIAFDEFLSNKLYLPDEFVSFMNVVSTIVRRREDVSIFMLGNTVNKFCPYFEEMGLNHIPKMQQGSIDLYRYGESGLTVAVEYCAPSSGPSSETHKYFAFDNPKLEMITGGAWEMALYPHLPYKYKPKDVLLTFFIVFSNRTYQCEVVNVEGVMFIFIHNKTTPIQDQDNDLIYTLEHNPKFNYNRSIYRPTNKVQERILWFFRNDRVFYQSNDVGDAVSNYLKICKKL